MDHDIGMTILFNLSSLKCMPSSTQSQKCKSIESTILFFVSSLTWEGESFGNISTEVGKSFHRKMEYIHPVQVNKAKLASLTK